MDSSQQIRSIFGCVCSSGVASACYNNNVVNNELHAQHWWFSGKIGRCHWMLGRPTTRPAPGSIPGRCNVRLFLMEELPFAL
jgi:hypothetical protein